MAHPKDEPVTVKLSLTIPPRLYRELQEIARHDGYPGERALLLDILKTSTNKRWMEYMQAKEERHRNRNMKSA